MSESARVRDVGALDELRGALAEFGGHAMLALEGVDAALRRALDWLEDQDRYWQSVIRTQEDAVHTAKQELSRRRIMKVSDRPPDCTEQEEELRRARRRLEFAQEKQEATRHWLRQWGTEMIEFEGPTRQLKSFLEADLPRARALLQGKAETLENYLALLPAAESRPAPAANGGNPK